MAYPRHRPFEAGARPAAHLHEVGSEPAEIASGVAIELTQARLARGLDRRDIAEKLRIRDKYLAAIEDGRFGDLPGGAYTIGYLRSYAAHLGLDAENIVTRFRDEDSGYGARRKLEFPSPAEDGRVPTAPLLAVALALSVSAYFGWNYANNLDRFVSDKVSEVPARLAGQSPPPVPVDLAESRDALGGVAALSVSEVAASETEGADPVTGSAVEDGSGAGGVAAVSMSEVAASETEGADPVTGSAVEDESDAGGVAAVSMSEFAASETEGADPVTGSAVEDGSGAGDVAAVSMSEVAASEAEGADPVTGSAVEDGSGAGGVAAASMSEIAASETEGADPVTGSAAEAPTVSAGELAEETRATPEAAVPGSVAVLPTPTASIPPAPPPDVAARAHVPRVYGQGNADSRINIRATQESWIQVTSVDNDLLLTRILYPGDVYRVPNRSGLMLMTGNVGALEITVDGRRAPPLGRVGDVRRDVPLDPDRLLAGETAR